MFVFCCILIFLVLVEIKVKQYLIKSGLLLKEFPKVDQNVIKKYKTFHSKLGWKPIETKNHPDNTGSYIGLPTETSYSIDKSGSRTFNNHPIQTDITTFGDSFCMCREVNDTETLQYFLSQKTSSFVTNYGVGNYGIDQALLRLEAINLSNMVNHIIMIITPWTIERIISVWKHYCEPGNILAAKPRFILSNGRLKLIDNFIKQPSDFFFVKKHKNFLHKYDGNYPFFQEQESNLSKTALVKLFKDKKLFDFLRASMDAQLKRKKGIRREIIVKDFLKLAEPFLIEKFNHENTYLQMLYQKEEMLLEAIVKRFVNFCLSQKKTPYLLVLPAYTHITFIKNGNDLYRSVFRTISNKYNLKYIDMFDHLSQFDQNLLKTMYVDIYGHHSAKGNEYVATTIYNRWFKTTQL